MVDLRELRDWQILHFHLFPCLHLCLCTSIHPYFLTIFLFLHLFPYHNFLFHHFTSTSVSHFSFQLLHPNSYLSHFFLNVCCYSLLCVCFLSYFVSLSLYCHFLTTIHGSNILSLCPLSSSLTYSHPVLPIALTFPLSLSSLTLSFLISNSCLSIASHVTTFMHLFFIHSFIHFIILFLLSMLPSILPSFPLSPSSFPNLSSFLTTPFFLLSLPFFPAFLPSLSFSLSSLTPHSWRTTHSQPSSPRTSAWWCTAGTHAPSPAPSDTSSVVHTRMQRPTGSVGSMKRCSSVRPKQVAQVCGLVPNTQM